LRLEWVIRETRDARTASFFLALESIGKIMAAKRVASRHPMASVVRDQVLRPEFQQAMKSANPIPAAKNVPKRFLDLLDRLDAAEARKKKGD
jgi:hypothetical protein